MYSSFSLSSQSPVAFQTACGPGAFLPLKLKWAGTFSALPQKECWAMRCVPSSKWKWLSVRFWNAPWVLSEPVISHAAPQSSLCTHGNAPFENKNRAPCSYCMHWAPSLQHGQNGFSSSFLRTENTLHIPLWNSSSMSPQTQCEILLYNHSTALNLMAPKHYILESLDSTGCAFSPLLLKSGGVLGGWYKTRDHGQSQSVCQSEQG